MNKSSANGRVAQSAFTTTGLNGKVAELRQAKSFACQSIGMKLALAVVFTSTAAQAQSSVQSVAASTSTTAAAEDALLPGPGILIASTSSPASDPNANTVIPGSAGIPSAAAPGAPNALSTAAATVGGTGVPQDPYANYRWKGLIINFPLPSNTIDLDAGGLRRKLADDYGIGYIGLATVTFYDNALRHDHHGLQSYFGQKPSVLSQNIAAVTLDLSRYGIPDGQIVVEGTYQTTSWNAGGPTTLNLGTLSYFQTLFNKHLDVKIGLLGNSFEYVGVFTAGSLSSGQFGVGAQLSGETGLNAILFPSYGINLTAHITRNFYDKFGVARATDPGGIVLEHNNNPTGLNFNTPNSGAYVINELGYRTLSTPGSMSTWLRTGASYSASHYAEEDHPKHTSDHNYFLYLLGDRQLLKVSSAPKESYRGLYAGFSVEYAPPNLNPFSQYYEARLYGLGLLPHRPFDQMALIFTDNIFSQFFIERLNSVHQLTHTDSKAITASYSFQVTHGVYLNAGLSYIDNPTPFTYTSSTGSAINVIGGAAVYF